MDVDRSISESKSESAFPGPTTLVPAALPLLKQQNGRAYARQDNAARSAVLLLKELPPAVWALVLLTIYETFGVHLTEKHIRSTINRLYNNVT